MSDRHDDLLTETIARHFPTARVDKNEIDLGAVTVAALLRVRCWTLARAVSI
jgi:hypothetical protein